MLCTRQRTESWVQEYQNGVKELKSSKTGLPELSDVFVVLIGVELFLAGSQFRRIHNYQ